MDTKLTLSINKDIIEEAKKSKDQDKKISPLVKSLSGVLKLDDKTDQKKMYGDYLANKYVTKPSA